MYRTIGWTLCVLLWLCSSRQPPAREIWRRGILPMRTCVLASFSSQFSVLEATAIEQGRDGGSFSLRETRFIGRLTGQCAPATVSLATGSKSVEEIAEWKGVVALAIPHLYSLCNTADASSIFFIECSILVILNAYCNTGYKSMHSSFDPPTQVTINKCNIDSLLYLAHQPSASMHIKGHGTLFVSVSVCLCLPVCLPVTTFPARLRNDPKSNSNGCCATQALFFKTWKYCVQKLWRENKPIPLAYLDHIPPVSVPWRRWKL